MQFSFDISLYTESVSTLEHVLSVDIVIGKDDYRFLRPFGRLLLQRHLIEVLLITVHRGLVCRPCTLSSPRSVEVMESSFMHLRFH
jgi:hypothetical protein